MAPDVMHCDNCGTELAPAECDRPAHTLLCTLRRHSVGALPVPVAHVGAGGPAALCSACYCAVVDEDVDKVRALTTSKISY